MLSPARDQPDVSRFEDRIVAAVAAHDFFSPDRPVWVARAPGRLDFMGGNVDYTGGMVLQGILREAVWVAAQPRTDDIVRVLNPEAKQRGWTTGFELHLHDLTSPESVRSLCEQQPGAAWGCYVLGSLHLLRRSHGCDEKGGIDLFITSDLPPNKGVSSSAALEIATLKAAATAWEISLEGVALATAGQWVENVVAGAACGIMDQAAIVLGRKDHLSPMLCQPCQPSPAVTLPASLCIWGIDSMAPRSTTGMAYEAARAAAFMGYKLICRREGIDLAPDKDSEIPRWTDSRWSGYLSNLAPSEFRARYERWLPESMTGKTFLEQAGEHVDPFTKIHPDHEYPVRAAARYAVEENLRVQTVKSLLESSSFSESESTLHLIGEILCQSHVAYGECGLGSAACNELVELALRSRLPGAKMTGGGAGGVVAILGRTEDRPIVHSIAEEYAARHGAMPHIFEGSSDGADAFGVQAFQPAHIRSVQ